MMKVSSMQLLVHDTWTNFKSSLHSISCCRNRIKVDSEIWPGLNEIKKNIDIMLKDDFDLLCVLKVGDME